jgi:hypothetical protein
VNEVVGKSLVITPRDRYQNFQVITVRRIAPESVALVSRDRPLFSRPKLALDTLDLVAERSGEDLELLDLVIMVVIQSSQRIVIILFP